MKKTESVLSGLLASRLSLPRPHLYAILMLVFFSLASVTLLPAPNTLFSNKPLQIADENLSDNAELSKLAANTEFIGEPLDLLGDEVSSAASDELSSLDYTVKDDDNLSSVFNTLNIPAATLQQLLSVDIHNALVNLKPNQKLSFYLDNQHHLNKLEIPAGEDSNVVFERTKTGFRAFVDGDEATTPTLKKADVVEKVDVAEEAPKAKPVLRPTRIAKGAVKGSFAASAQAAGLNATQTRQVVRFFQGRIDFRRHLNKGDTFRVLLDRPMVDGQAADNAKVLAAIVQVKGKTYSAYRSLDDNQFYDDAGNNLSTSVSGRFMRYPIPSSPKTSSGFNPTRRNPVTGIVMPHNGTDFPVHVGTPVETTGDGVVVKTAIHPSCGIYIVVRHNARYSSVYMHLSKSLVKTGQQLKMGQVIALSGNTGRTTGPHLHYEFHVDDHPVDAMRVDLPMNDGAPAKAKRSLLAKIKDYQHQLNHG
jgi:murein DD-endopeptidase